MAIDYKKQVAHLRDQLGAEEADTLFSWLQENPKASLNLSRCTHLHAAVLQVLILLRPSISVWPDQVELTHWLKPLLPSRQTEKKHG